MPGVAGIDTLQQDITFRGYAVLLHARVAILVLSDGGTQIHCAIDCRGMICLRDRPAGNEGEQEIPNHRYGNTQSRA